MSLNIVAFDCWGEGPTPAQAKSAGVQARTWYASFDSSKDGPVNGPAHYAAAGIWSVTNFETTVDRVYAGYPAGQADANRSLDEYIPRGMPKGAVSIASADRSIPVEDFGKVLPYYQGYYQACSARGYIAGCYGEQALIQNLKQAGAIQVGWKSMSTSFPGGGTEAYCDIVQTLPGTIGSTSIDWDSGKVEFFGQWMPGVLYGQSPDGAPEAQAPAPVPTPSPDADSAAWRATHNTYTPLTVDGVFGPQTIKALQWVDSGTGVDGVFGLDSKKALQGHLGVPRDGVIGPVTVKALQARVKALVDGSWGAGTTRSLQTALNAGTF